MFVCVCVERDDRRGEVKGRGGRGGRGRGREGEERERDFQLTTILDDLYQTQTRYLDDLYLILGQRLSSSKL